jgi:dipeptidase D
MQAGVFGIILEYMEQKRTTTERVFQIFKELNQIPRPSHHEERVADYLCRFAERQNLPYKRDKENCVVISKPATQGYEGAEPVVLLNHMDMSTIQAFRLPASAHVL